MKIALGIQYDGTPFSGWQVQPDRPTVQQTLEEALGAFAGIGQPVPTICAGRTDTGVHATGQVVHIEAPVERPMNAWVRGTNSFLPPAVAVRWAKPVPEDFSARFSAIVAAGPKVIPEMLGTYVGLSSADRRNINQALMILLQAALSRNPKVQRK